MLNKLAFTCNAVLPIILVILLGYFLKRIKLLPDGFWKLANKLCFRICLPILLFYNVYNVSDITKIFDSWEIVVYAVAAIVGVFLIGLVIAIIFIKDEKQKGVILQCVFRSNYAIIGIPLAASLSGGNPEVEALASVISAISIPLFNILAIVALSLFVKEDGKKVSVKSIVLKIVKNPLIIGVFCGIVVLLIRQLIPFEEVLRYSIDSKTGEVKTSIVRDYAFTIKNNIPFLYTTLGNISKIASPLALIALGGDFTFSAIGRLKNQIIMGTLLRVILVPALCLIAAYLIGFRQNEFPALIALFGTPVAVSSVPMSAEMNNDEELAGQLVVWTSISSAFTLFIIIFTCSLIGIF
ncbi:MAG: AEC family transporter [Anaeroplasma sp.]